MNESGNSQVTLEFCKNIPKIELHAHLNGCIRKSTLLELLQKKRPDYNTSFLDTNDLKGAFKIFEMIHIAVTTLEDTCRVLREVLEDFELQNTVYIEIRTTPRAFGDLTLDDTVKALVEEILNFNKISSVMTAKLLLSINRAESLEKARETVLLAKKYRESSGGCVVGVELSGNPYSNHFKDFKELFEQARGDGLKSSLHVAERPVKDCEHETDMVLEMNPERVGHFNYFTEKQLLTLIEKKIAVETCPTSNKCTMELKGYNDHHFDKFFKAKIPLTICTDDTLVFHTDISNEIYQICRTFSITKKQCKEIILSGVQSIFAEGINDKIYKMIDGFEIDD